MTSIESYFANSWCIRNTSTLPKVSIEEGAFPAFLEVDISQDKSEVPATFVEEAIWAKEHNYTKIVCNLLHAPDTLGVRTVQKKNIKTILQRFSYFYDSYRRLAHIVTSKNLHYYGTSGMILNGNYDPLMLATIEVDFNAAKTDHDFLSNPRLRLSYKTFENSSEIIEKTIIKQAIPYFSRNSIYIIYYGTQMGPIQPVEIIIGHLESMIVKPVAPTISDVNTFNNTISNAFA